jgi:ketosteroid isomerase-like protein
MLTRILLIVFVAASATAQQNAVSDIQRVLDMQTDAWNRGDLTGFMQGYWNSPETTFFGGKDVVHGWQQTLDRYRANYQGSGKEMGKLSFTEQRIEILGPDAALATARWHLTFGSGDKKDGLTSLTLRRMKDGWKIVHDHSS